jgi:RNA polymerase sigma factor (sigma-70 family)
VEKTHKETFIELYEPIHNQFCRYCRAIAGNAEDAEDLIQDAVLNVLLGFDKIKNIQVFKSYLFSVAGNLNRMKHRRHKLNARFSTEEARQIMDHEPDQESLADFTIVYEKILLLPPRMAETLVLFHISDLSYDEIQHIQGGSLSGVKLRLKRGREKLLSMLNTPSEVKMAQLLSILY